MWIEVVAIDELSGGALQYLAVCQVNHRFPLLIIVADVDPPVAPVALEVYGEGLVIRRVIQLPVAVEVDITDRLGIQYRLARRIQRCPS